MFWIVGLGIDENEAERKARLQYIKKVSGDKYITWKKGPYDCYYYCETKDGINGAFVTGHNIFVETVCCLPSIIQFDVIIANTCIVVQGKEYWVLHKLKSRSYNGQLYYAKQTSELWKEDQYDFNIVSKEGTFGFKTSKSERILFRNRRKGLWEAVSKAFDLVVLEGVKNAESEI